jgi:hypothetical protein
MKIGRPKTHGLTGTRILGIYYVMHSRCYNRSDSRYSSYGGRGIKVCNEWHDPLNFAKWAYANGYSDNLSIDRIDNDGDYSPENCRWATLREQASHTRRSRLVTAFGETKSVPLWADDPRCSVSMGTIHTRLRIGWSEQDAIALPLQRPWRAKKGD